MEDIASWFESHYTSLLAWLGEKQQDLIDSFDLPDWFGWLGKFGVALFNAAKDLSSDFLLFSLENLLSAVSSLIGLLPVPEFLTAYTPQLLLGSMSGPVLYVLMKLGLPQTLSIIGAGFTFRLTRKLVTIGRW